MGGYANNDAAIFEIPNYHGISTTGLIDYTYNSFGEIHVCGINVIKNQVCKIFVQHVVISIRRDMLVIVRAGGMEVK